jgi:hypothetical protein
MKQRDESGGGSDFVMSTMLHGFASLHSCVDGGGDATVSCLCEGGALALGTTVRDRLGRLGHVAGPASLRAAAQAWSADGSILAVAAAGGGVQLYIGSALALLAPRIAPSMRGVCATTRVAVAFVAATRTVRVDDPRPPLPQRHIDRATERLISSLPEPFHSMLQSTTRRRRLGALCHIKVSEVISECVYCVCV